MLDAFKFSKNYLMFFPENGFLGSDAFCFYTLIGKYFLQFWGPSPPLSSEVARRRFKIAKAFL